MVRCFLSLGSNLGRRAEVIARAITLLSEGGVIVKKKSALYETEPWGIFEKKPNQFLNMVISCETKLSPRALLKLTQKTEKKLGRIHQAPSYSSRPIDLDILFYGSRIIKTPILKIPHPHIALRRFVLIPLLEIAPRHFHPQLKKTVHHLLKECRDTCRVRRVAKII